MSYLLGAASLVSILCVCLCLIHIVKLQLDGVSLTLLCPRLSLRARTSYVVDSSHPPDAEELR